MASNLYTMSKWAVTKEIFSAFGGDFFMFFVKYWGGWILNPFFIPNEKL